MLYFWLLKRRWIAERGRHLAVGSRTAGNCWIWITAQELGHWSTAFHNSLHGLNPRRIPAVHKLTGFCCLLLKLSYHRHRLWSTSLVALGKNRALLLQFPADSATNRIKVVWGYLGMCSWGLALGRSVLIQTGLCVSQLNSFLEGHTPLPSTHPQGNTDWSWAREQSKLPQGSCWSKVIASYRSVLWTKSENEGLHLSSGFASRKAAA